MTAQSECWTLGRGKVLTWKVRGFPEEVVNEANRISKSKWGRKSYQAEGHRAGDMVRWVPRTLRIGVLSEQQGMAIICSWDLFLDGVQGK